MAQRDPLVEYQREGGDMFNAMMEAFMEEVVGFIFHLEVEVTQTPQVGVVTGADGTPVQVTAGRNGQDQGDGDKPLVESGPDPDGPGVTVNVRDEDASEDELSEIVSELPPTARAEVRAKGLSVQRSRALTYSAPDEDGTVKTAGAPTRTKQDDPYAGVSRNAPCPCGSGKKFKMCHGRSGAV
jgi:preprotein translocase subunit SecA